LGLVKGNLISYHQLNYLKQYIIQRNLQKTDITTFYSSILFLFQKNKYNIKPNHYSLAFLFTFLTSKILYFPKQRMGQFYSSFINLIEKRSTKSLSQTVFLCYTCFHEF